MPVTYKCPSCGGAMTFDTASQMLHCPQCGKELPIGEFESGQETAGQSGEAAGQSGETAGQSGEAAGQTGERGKTNAQNMKVYHCSSCGAELVADAYTSATICAFCGNPSLVEDRLEGEFKPSRIIPFRLSREQAVEKYKEWLKQGALTPSSLSATAMIDKITGIYVPFWLYDFDARTQMNAAAEMVHTERHGDVEEVITDHYAVFRDVHADFDRIPADAAEKMPDDAMDKLEPFQYEELKEFEMPYLSGYLSERYTYSADEMKERAQKRADQYITDIARNTIAGYSNVVVTGNNISMENTKEEYALLPVWILSYRYRNKDYQFMLNGQTGRIVADRPVSMGKTVAWGTGVFLLTLLITMIGGLFF